MSLRDDFLMRTMSQLARTLEEAAGFRGEGDLEQARRTLEAARTEHFGSLATLLPQVDLVTAVGLLGSPERIVGWAALLEEQAAILRAMDDPAAALPLETRAAALRQAADERRG